jgi:hypothetical protein
MSRLSFLRACRLAVGVLAGLAAHTTLHAEDSFGVARISDRSATVIRAQSPDADLAMPAAPAAMPIADTAQPMVLPIRQAQCAVEPQSGHPVTYSHGSMSGIPTDGSEYSISCPAHNGIFDPSCPECQSICGHLGYNECPDNAHCGSGFFEKCGRGCRRLGNKCFDFWGDMDSLFGNGPGQPLVGHYKVTYPVNPGYFDGRDGQVYAAQGYGGPVSVPLAPVVRHTYNYGWGVPSSRLTPISRPLPHGARP